jgi:GNAT superfamily N-acetyltransferase
MARDLDLLRRQARTLLDLTAARDALAAYYALYHSGERTELLVEEGSGGRTDGLLAICQTGWDLFRQIAVLRARNVTAATALLRRGLQPLRPYYVLTTPELVPAVDIVLQIEEMERTRIYRLDMGRYSPLTNVLVVPVRSDDGATRFVIRSRGKIAAEAGINWRSPHFAEIYVRTAPEAQGRGWGKAVVESCASWLIRSAVQPIYVVSEGNERSIRLAKSVGFVDTGARELAFQGSLGGGKGQGPEEG